MERIIPILVVTSLIIIGFGFKYYRLVKINKRFTYCDEYHANYVKLINIFVQSKTLDQLLYYDLTKEVVAMQSELGADGVGYYQDNLRGFASRNYPLLINFLPELQRIQLENSNSIMWERFINSANDCNNMFIRHKGNLERLSKLYRSELFNPFSCFADGIKLLLSLPIQILQWLGLISDDFAYKINNSSLSRLINSLVVLLGAISAIITIAIGWNDFVNMLRNLFQR